MYDKIPEVKDIFDGNEHGLPTRPETAYALSSKIVSYARGAITQERLKNAIEYVSRMQSEFRGRVFSDLLRIKKLVPYLKKDETYANWFMRSGLYWEDYE